MRDACRQRCPLSSGRFPVPRAAAVLLAALWMGAGIGLAANLKERPALEPRERARIEPWAWRLWEGKPVRGKRSLLEFDAALLDAGRIRLQLDRGPGGPPLDRLRHDLEAAVPALIWEGAVGPWVQVTLPIDALAHLARVPGFLCAVRPPRPHPLISSKGADEIGASIYVARGFGGEGVRIGILDVGFEGVAELLGSELPADTQMRAFYGSPSGNGDLSGGGSDHGTACAEIVHDVAPGAQLFLANANTATELAAAAAWLREQGVAVISHSVGWLFGAGDGTGPIDEIALGAIDDGIVWVNAVGNQAEAYWQDEFTDTDGDGYHEFTALGDESITATAEEDGRDFWFVLTWDRWPHSTDLSFEIEVWESGRLVISSHEEFADYPYAYREVEYARTTPSSRLDVAIRRTVGEEAARLRLFRVDGGAMPEHAVAAGSVVLPADAPGVISVGAYRVEQGFLEDFSSRGPTQSGVAKPELCAPDGVLTATTSPHPFGGTSAACPHVAGAVAILRGITPPGGFFDFHWSVSEVRQILAAAAAPDGFSDGQACLWGLLRMPELPASAGPAVGGMLRLTSPLRPPFRLTLPMRGPGPVTIRLFDATGRRLIERQSLSPAGSLSLLHWDGRDSAGRSVPSGICLLQLSGHGWQAQGRFLLVR